MITQLQPGDWIGTRGHAAWWNPLSWLYWGIRNYESAKYPKTVWNPQPILGIDHAMLVMPEREIFEMTFPVGRFRSFKQAELAKKLVAGDLLIARFGNATIDRGRLESRAWRWEGKPYDLTDLPSFALSGLLGIFGRMIPFIGSDKLNRFKTCSPTAADILQFAGVPFPVDAASIDPAGPFNAFGKPADESAPWWPTNITSQLTKENFT